MNVVKALEVRTWLSAEAIETHYENEPSLFDIDGHSHLTAWTSSMDEVVTADTHEALARLYQQTHRQKRGDLHKVKSTDWV